MPRALDAALVAAALACPAAASGEEESPPGARDERVAARVDDVPITMDDLVRELMARHGSEVLEDMIRRRVLEAEIARSGLAVTEREIDDELARQRYVHETRPGPRTAFEAVVAEKYRVTLKGYRELVRRWLLVRKLILAREDPSEGEVLLWFYRNKEKYYDVPAEITVRHLFIAKEDPGTGASRADSDLRERVARVRDGLVRGEDFGRLVRSWSDDAATRDSGGDLGTLDERAARANLEPAFAEAMAALRPGQAGGPVETQKGFHFLQVTARKEGRSVEFDEVSRRVRADYLEERAGLLRDVFVRGLLERTRIERLVEFPREDAAAEKGGP